MQHVTSNIRGTRRGTLVAVTALFTAALAGGTAYAASNPAHDTASRASAIQVSHAAAPAQAKLRLQPSSAQLATCFPHARSKVVVDLTTDDVGFDTFKIRASGLKRNTAFTVFLIEKAGAPFGHVEYIGDIFTNRYGRAHNAFHLIAEEAFAFNNETGDRTDLNSVGFWFADSKDDDGCLGVDSPVTGFDGDAEAGVQMMNSGVHVLP
jgi:hypothetical protein